MNLASQILSAWCRRSVRRGPGWDWSCVCRCRSTDHAARAFAPHSRSAVLSRILQTCLVMRRRWR